MARRSTPTPPPAQRKARPSLVSRDSLPEGPSSRRTLDVDPTWLEAPREPPPLEGAAAQHDTLEVKLDWLDDRGSAPPSAPGAPPSRRPAASTPVPSSVGKPAGKAKRKKGMRPSIDPSWLPPQPDEHAREALPPPLPSQGPPPVPVLGPPPLPAEPPTTPAVEMEAEASPRSKRGAKRPVR